MFPAEVPEHRNQKTFEDVVGVEKTGQDLSKITDHVTPADTLCPVIQQNYTGVSREGCLCTVRVYKYPLKKTYFLNGQDYNNVISLNCWFIASVAKR